MAKKTATNKKAVSSKVAGKAVKKGTAVPMKAKKPKVLVTSGAKPKAGDKGAVKSKTKAQSEKIKDKDKESSIKVASPKVSAKNMSSSKKKEVKVAPSTAASEKPVARPALMTKKGREKTNSKVAVEVEESETVVKPVAKSKSVVSMMESDFDAEVSEEVTKAEKVSKIKPIKVDRGNLADEKAKWEELHRKYGKEKAVSYKMSEKFNAMSPIQHKVLGWGFVLTNENDRLEVLFETGIRNLISNYKS